ncbi:hypothetical protein O181_012320 [Austropuccinia psidii MF-1]|uniref:Uncharacterized protein n=1 Tax=Austropuccinia psidii MF-1 TaxID=1389203 RepID=A0A9Q3BXS2_9BASI|nr:hypothetical protein [Austropuccinia psidii MF-1]
MVDRNYLDNNFPNWAKKLLQTKEKSFKSASEKMTSIGTIIKEIITPHRKGNIRLKPEFVVRDEAHIQGFLLGKDYQSVTMLSARPQQRELLSKRLLNRFKYQLILASCRSHSTM